VAAGIGASCLGTSPDAADAAWLKARATAVKAARQPAILRTGKPCPIVFPEALPASWGERSHRIEAGIGAKTVAGSPEPCSSKNNNYQLERGS
jgi:hypothetical protein